MVHIRLLHMSGAHMSGAHMTLAPRWWRRWQRSRPYPGTEAARQTRWQRPMRRAIGLPIGQHWELQFYWYE